MSAVAMSALPAAAPAAAAPAGLEGRLHLIDAFRAVAALAVFGFHISPHLGGVVAAVAEYGWLGVQVFFTVSGFVIAHTLKREPITPRYAANFVFRRSIRLAPPYWVVIAFTILLLAVSNAVWTDRTLDLPNWSTIAAHVLYLQNILGHGDIVDVFWSLCIEIQFYLAFIFLMGGIQTLSPDRQSLRGPAAFAAGAVFTLLAGLSFAAPSLGLPPRVWLLTYWNEFFMGVLAAWVLERRVGRAWFFAFASGLTAAALCAGGRLEPLAAVATAGVILWAGERGWLLCRWRLLGIDALGRTSYSFYLVHTLVLARLTRLLFRVGMPAGSAPLLIIPLGFVGSIGAAAMLCWLAERPCIRLSRRWKLSAAVAP